MSKRKLQSNCTQGLWDLNIPTELLREILSRLGLKANLRASLACKTWFEAALSVRKLQPRPSLFRFRYRSRSSCILPNPLVQSQQSHRRIKLNFPKSDFSHAIHSSKDGWVLMKSIQYGYLILFNPFTKKGFHRLPKAPKHDGSFFAFSAPPTSPSCVVITCHQPSLSHVEISTWRPGETVWTTHRFDTPKPFCTWEQRVYSNGMFYCLSTCGYLGVFDPSKVTWNILPVKPPALDDTIDLVMPWVMTEHEGDIFVIYESYFNPSNVLGFKLNLKRNVWEEKKDLGGLTIFAGHFASFTRAGLSAEEKNRIYSPHVDDNGQCGMYYYLGDGESSPRPTSFNYVDDFAWMDPPHDLVIDGRSRTERPNNSMEVENQDYKEVLDDDVVEEILSRVSLKSLLQFKTVSKQWRHTIESRSFAERHLKIAERSRCDHPEVLVVTLERDSMDFGFTKTCLDSNTSLNHLKIPKGRFQSEASNSCDGLVCIFEGRSPFIYVVNPATCWFRQLPQSRFQILMAKATYTRETRQDIKPMPRLAFTKATPCGYKLVWLYNSTKYNSDVSSPNEGFTKCEVFDSRANRWRYLPCTPNYRIFDDQSPAYANGKVYWLTERHKGKTKVVAFDVRTETFRMLSNKITPAAHSHPDHIDMCSLNNRLCMSRRKGNSMIQEIWILQSSSLEEDAWENIYTIDLRYCCLWSETGFGYSWTRKRMVRPSTPVKICKNNKILLSHRYAEGLVEYDPQTKSYSLFPQHFYSGRVVSYFPTLISHI